MKELDFNPHKSTADFRKNYKLHDQAEIYGKNLLIQWGFHFEEFGEDNRHSRVWEEGNDKPDLIIEYRGKKAMVDWKGKHHNTWLANERAVRSYEKWIKKFNMPMFICFAVFDGNNLFLEFRFACLGKHKYSLSHKKEWDKNSTVEFEKDLPELTKPNILKCL